MDTGRLQPLWWVVDRFIFAKGLAHCGDKSVKQSHCFQLCEF